MTDAEKALGRVIQKETESMLGACPVDRIDLLVHPRCSACHILTGPGHLERHIYGGLCATCRRFYARRRVA